jgi:hypothetical protein
MLRETRKYLTFREEHRYRVFENRVLMRIFGPKKEEIAGDWRKLHNEELHSLYLSPNSIRMIKFRTTRWAGRVARMGQMRHAHKMLVGKLEGKRPLGRLRRRREDNIKLGLTGK